MTGVGGHEAIERYVDVMNRLAVDELADLFTDDVVVTLPYAPDPVPKRTEGKEAVTALYGGFPHLVGPLGFHDLDIRSIGDSAGGAEFVATYRSDSTMLSTGKPYRNDYIALFTVRDDRLAAFTEYFDPLVFQQAQVP